MSEAFVGEIRIFAGNFPPRSHAYCDGQLLAISQNDALFSLLGTIYGGDGRSTFALPDLRGRIPIHYGNGPGLTPRTLGNRSGAENQTLTANELGGHSHGPLQAVSTVADDTQPSGKLMATASTAVYVNETPNTLLHGDSITPVGGSQQHTNVMPFLCVHFIIALFGIYPSRS